jgi:hypothetical protein
MISGMTKNWKFLLYGFCLVATCFSLFNVYKSHLRSQRSAQIETELDALKVRQLDLKDRFDKLAAETAKAPNDPIVLKELGTRHLKLVEETDALKADLSRVQKEIDTNKR